MWPPCIVKSQMSPRSPPASSAWRRAADRSGCPPAEADRAASAAARKWELQVQLVDPAHDGEIGRRHRLGQIIYIAPAECQLPGLTRQRQCVRPVDHRFALGNRPAHCSQDWAQRSGQKIIHKRQLADLGVQCLYVDRRLSSLDPRLAAKYTGSPLKQLPAPLRDLIGMNVKQLGQLRQRLLALHGSQCHLCLECRTVVPAGSFTHLHSCHTDTMAAVRQKIDLSACAGLPSHLARVYRRCVNVRPPFNGLTFYRIGYRERPVDRAALEGRPSITSPRTESSRIHCAYMGGSAHQSDWLSIH